MITGNDYDKALLTVEAYQRKIDYMRTGGRSMPFSIKRLVYEIDEVLISMMPYDTEDIIISIPEYMIVHLVDNFLQSDDTVEASNTYLFGCKVQYAYENRITVFHKGVHFKQEGAHHIYINQND